MPTFCELMSIPNIISQDDYVSILFAKLFIVISALLVANGKPQRVVVKFRRCLHKHAHNQDSARPISNRLQQRVGGEWNLSFFFKKEIRFVLGTVCNMKKKIQRLY